MSKLSEFLQNQSEAHIKEVDHALAYLEGTKHYAIEFDGHFIDEKRVFAASSDAAYGDDPETRYSSNGFVFQLFGVLIHWQATKQKTVVTSLTEAELLALLYTAKELIWWQRFFQAICFDTEQHV
jgi:hypothetical protein